ncbi:hypothetical protein CLOM_g18570 [Closterium sp. NIES-68]|nr:hypothetical protein CLOM_g18570 [Closterium sp. NIES-68]GJP81050.1 hypothetical protein CLOP_g11229 [Closterium sp. NIES-67]
MTSALRSSARHLRSALTAAVALPFRPSLPRAPCMAAAVESSPPLPLAFQRPTRPPRPTSLAPCCASPPAQPARLRGATLAASCAAAFAAAGRGAASAGAMAPVVSSPLSPRLAPPQAPAELSTLVAPTHAVAGAMRALPALATSAALGSQRRGVFVEVRRGDVDRAIKKFKIKLRLDNAIRVARARSHYWKPAELRRLRTQEEQIRRQQRDFRQKLSWIMAKRSRGF